MQFVSNGDLPVNPAKKQKTPPLFFRAVEAEGCPSAIAK
jgi:hypothetical protein